MIAAVDVLAVLQARMSSTRLPGKVLKPVLGQPLLALEVERVQRARCISRLVIATSTDAGDDAVAALGAQLGVDVFRGSLADVLDRYYRAAQPHAPQHVLRITGDCPLIDPQVLDALIAQHLAEHNDYTSNTLQRSFPKGLDAEIFRFDFLEAAWREAKVPDEREHVTPYMYRRPHPQRRLGRYGGTPDRSALRWTVDYPQDLEFVRAVYERLYPARPDFTSADVLALLAREPQLAQINVGLS